MIIAKLIEAHRAAVLVDEANFTDDGEAIDDAAALASGELERKAFVRLVDAQCASDDEVQSKLQYFMHGTIGERSDLLVYLDMYDQDEAAEALPLSRRLLASMRVGGSA